MQKEHFPYLDVKGENGIKVTQGRRPGRPERFPPIPHLGIVTVNTCPTGSKNLDCLKSKRGIQPSQAQGPYWAQPLLAARLPAKNQEKTGVCTCVCGFSYTIKILSKIKLRVTWFVPLRIGPFWGLEKTVQKKPFCKLNNGWSAVLLSCTCRHSRCYKFFLD